ncbi:hypothetical protein ZEAMMB73_Zm00001d038638 [Zea mays]|uniref:Uncharacterized protein n=1 Tax=Zea mays TaxID=4577 RepID=A0A1D6M7M7_MAIZE|nr:hypothetical protein ZEAMMB73_Zm00001d038638 [Zea mays]
MDAPLRGKSTARAAWRRPAVSCLLFVFVLVLLISTTATATATTVQSRQAGLTSRQRGSGFRAWRRDVLRPDRTAGEAWAPPAPKANSNVPGGPFGRR